METALFTLFKSMSTLSCSFSLVTNHRYFIYQTNIWFCQKFFVPAFFSVQSHVSSDPFAPFVLSSDSSTELSAHVPYISSTLYIPIILVRLHLITWHCFFVSCLARYFFCFWQVSHLSSLASQRDSVFLNNFHCVVGCTGLRFVKTFFADLTFGLVFLRVGLVQGLPLFDCQ